MEILGLGEENEEKRQMLIELAKDVAAATAALVQNAKTVAATATKENQQKVTIIMYVITNYSLNFR